MATAGGKDLTPSELKNAMKASLAIKECMIEAEVQRVNPGLAPASQIKRFLSADEGARPRRRRSYRDDEGAAVERLQKVRGDVEALYGRCSRRPPSSVGG